MRYSELILVKRKGFQSITLRDSFTSLPWTIPQPLLRLPEVGQGVIETAQRTQREIGSRAPQLLDGLFALLGAFGQFLEEWVGKSLERMGQEAKYQLGRTVDRAFQNAADAAARRIAQGESLEAALAEATKSFLTTMAQLPTQVLGAAPSAFAGAGADLFLAALNGAKKKEEEEEVTVTWEEVAKRGDIAFSSLFTAVSDVLYTLVVAELGRDEQGLAELVDEFVEDELAHNWKEWIRPLEVLSYPVDAGLFSLQIKRLLTPLAARKLPELLKRLKG